MKGEYMPGLVEALKRFNRKERYWLLRNALGADFERLDKQFMEQLGRTVGVSIPEDSWWAMDYHLDWLIGALHLLGGGQKNAPQHNTSKSVQGTQEDIDLIVAFESTLILVEAKADTSWSNSQLNSKVDRLSQIVSDQAPQSVLFKFVLMSPKKSEKLERIGGWPAWMQGGNGHPMFMRLEMEGGDLGFSKVVRCDENGKPLKEGKYWVVA